jgi:sulfonate dioxygenase
VHPATGWKSIYVDPVTTKRIVGVPKAESDAILAFLFSQISENNGFQMRHKWEQNDVVIWDNRVVMHSATYDYWPATRHALRVTPQGERPISVADYERTTAKRARDRQLDLWERQGIQLP